MFSTFGRYVHVASTCLLDKNILADFECVNALGNSAEGVPDKSCVSACAYDVRVCRVDDTHKLCT